MRRIFFLTLLSFILPYSLNAEEVLTLQPIPGAIVVNKKVTAKNFAVQLQLKEGNSFQDITPLHFCLEYNGSCEILEGRPAKYSKRKNFSFSGKESKLLRYDELVIPKSFLKQFTGRVSALSQGDSIELPLHAYSVDNELVASTAIAVFGPAKALRFRGNNKKIKKGKKKKKKAKKNKLQVRRIVFRNDTTRPSFSYESPGGYDAQVCQGGDVYNSYEDFLSCTDEAITTCEQQHSDEYDVAGCIYDRCGNLPDEIEPLWKEVDVNIPSKSGSQNYYFEDEDKRDWGSSAYSSHDIGIMMHPCFYDGAGNIDGNFGASATLMDYTYQLIQSGYTIFHPARSNNVNLSRSRVKMGFNFNTLIRAERDNFGQTTVPFSYQWEVFRSIERLKKGLKYEGADSTHFLNGVIPLYLYFRPQGVLGFEFDAQVLPVSRTLDFQYNAYGDFGSGFAAGPARNGVEGVTDEGFFSLLQAESSQRRYIALEAEEEGILPSLSDRNELEYWGARGNIKACAAWFPNTSHKNHQSEQCGYITDLGEISSREGSIRIITNGDPSILQYFDDSNEEERPLPGEYAPFPYRDPIMSHF